MSEQCCEKISRDWRTHKCGKVGKWEVNGKWYCGTHNPAAVERRKQRSDEKYRVYRAQQDEKYAREAYDRKAGEVCRELGLTDPTALRDENERLRSVLINMHAAWNNKNETTSLYAWNERMKVAMADVEAALHPETGGGK